MIDKHIEKILNNAFIAANQARYEFFTAEHMLLALCEKDTQTRDAFVYLGADIVELTQNLQMFLSKNSPKLLSDENKTSPTTAFHRIIERAAAQRDAAGKGATNGLHLVISIMDESESHAVYYIKKQGISKLDLMHYVSHLEQTGQDSDNEAEEKNERESALLKYATDLNAHARNGGIDDLIGREDEVERMLHVLSRRRKNNPILVGEAGVGKTAIVEGLAKKIVDGTVPAALRRATIYALDLGAMVAGSKYRGDFEKRIKSLIKELSSMDDAIVFIDEIHTLIGAGSTTDSTLDASNLLKPVLSSGQLRCIGATTYKEYKGSFEKNAALARRFQKIDIVEPSHDETVEIVKGLLPKFEQFHRVRYQSGVVEHAVDLAAKYIHDRHFPDKAIDLIDEVGARARLLAPPKKRVYRKDIESILAKIAKIPEKSLTSSDLKQLKNIERRLKLKVFGQDRAIEALGAAIKLSCAGLGDVERPIGSFLFTGPTGVGKTEVCKQLAVEMGLKFIRFDMSEYMEVHTVSRLIGSPPGYVGHEQGGLLTDAVANAPHCVLLLDEIEKAHPDIFNILLQIMDYGALTDSVGKTVRFHHVILIMTSNAGAREIEKYDIGFTTADGADASTSEATLKKVFSPEFRNRLSDIILFAPLQKAVVMRVIDKLIGQLAAQLVERNIRIRLQAKAKQWLLEHGYSAAMGARPMSRLIDKHIKQKLSESILFGELKKGGDVLVDVDKDNDDLTIRVKKITLAKS